MIKYVDDFKYRLYKVYEDGSKELAAWYDDPKKALKEKRFLESKGYTIKVESKD